MNIIQEQILRASLHTLCTSKEELGRWIRIYLGLDLPDTIVCVDEDHNPPSNSCPLDLVWEIYSKAQQGDDPKFQQVLAYAARGSGKTLAAAIIELLCLVHLKRDVVHLASIEPQSKICLDYISGFLRRPILREYVSAVNRRNLAFTRHVSTDGVTISPVEFAQLTDIQKDSFSEEKNEFKITVATVEACNGLHAPFMCVTGDNKVLVENYGEMQLSKYVEFLAKNKVDFSKEFDFVPGNVLPYNRFASFAFKKGVIDRYGMNHITYSSVNRIIKKKALVIEIKVKHVYIVEGRTMSHFESLKCTPDHIVMVQYVKGSKEHKLKWVEAGTINVGDRLKSIYDRSEVISATPAGEDWVYDLSLPEFSNFICSGIVVHNCLDELDITDPNAFNEAKNIPTSTRGDRKYPITLLTSTRKYSYGLVQAEIDKSSETNLQVRHWNIVDQTEICPPERHLPLEPKIEIYVNQDQLRAISTEAWTELPDSEKLTFEKKEGFSGCLKKCKMFSVCLGRLATIQKSKSPILRKVDVTQNDLFKGSLEMTKSQLMCWKPSSAGLVFPTFSRELHLISAQKMANLATGEEFDKNFGKQQLINLFKEIGADFVGGIDWGFTHYYSVVLGAIVGNVLYIIDVIFEHEKEILDRIQITQEKHKGLNVRYYPDSAYPSDIATYRKAGFNMVSFDKDVLRSIEAVRSRLFKGMGRNPSVYFLDGDPGVEILLKQIALYHWKMDKGGNLTDEPDKVDDDVLDSFRYICQNIEFNRLKPNLAQKRIQKELTPHEKFVREKIMELTGRAYTSENTQIEGDVDLKFII